MNKAQRIRNNISNSKSSSLNWRIYTIILVIFAISSLVVFRLFSLQVIANDAYTQIAQSQHNVTTNLEANRGEIFLNDVEDFFPLAVNKKFEMAYAVPKEVEDGGDFVEKVAPILSLEKDEIRRKIEDRTDPFEILKRKLSEEEVRKISESEIDGLYTTPEIYRYYPGSELASQVVGFVGSNGEEFRGMYGVESYWEEELKGETGRLSQERDSRGRWISISDRDLKPARDGLDFVLTINSSAQYEVERILREAMEKHSADSGSIVVMEPETGKVLAMASQPDFNPNNYSETEDISYFNNPVVSSPYESGSVFKPITMAIGVDDGKVSPDTEYVDTGSIFEAGYEIKNSEEKVYGKQNMIQVLEESINTGVIFVQKLVGNERFADYVERFGFGDYTHISLPAEVKGNINNLSFLKRDINFYTASFGQGISVTPIQLVSAYSALANGGTLMKPQIVEKIIKPNGDEIEIEPEEVRRVISEETSNQIGEMLRSVVVNGHGKRADVPGYLVGGKTGTAQVAKSGEKGYQEDVTVGSFIGYAPINDPKFVVLVKIENPKGVQWAESTAAPAFQKVMDFLLKYYNIEPTENPDESPLYK